MNRTHNRRFIFANKMEDNNPAPARAPAASARRARAARLQLRERGRGRAGGARLRASARSVPVPLRQLRESMLYWPWCGVAAFDCKVRWLRVQFSFG